MSGSLKERLLAKTTILDNGCWEFTGGHDSWGYGAIYHEGRQLGAHKASWIAHKGEVGNSHVLHTCDNRSCINPDHLYLGSHQDNMKDRDLRGRQFSGLTRLSEEEVREIKNFLGTTSRTLEDIGRQFNVTKHTIFDIKRERTWSHVR